MDPNINSLPVVEQYLQYYEYYSKIYDKVAILYQSGAHYNIFSTLDRPTNIMQIHKDVNLTLTCRDKSKPERGSYSNPFLCGFPIISLHDYIKKFLSCGYTVVEIVQNKSKHLGKSEFREVSQIYTIGTYISEMNDDIYVVFLYIKKNAAGIGMTSININTGSIIMHEAYNNVDKNYAIDEVNRFIAVHNPQEIYYYSKDEYSQWKKYTNPFVNDSSVDAFLEKIYNNRKMLNVDNYLNVEMQPFAKNSLALLLHYLYTHNTSLLRNIRKPHKWDDSKHMCLSNNTIQQLDICTHINNDLLKLLNHTITPMGGRLFRYRLLNPSFDAEIINARYDEIDRYDEYEKYRVILRNIRDLDRDLRFIERECLSPKDLGFFIESINECYKLFKIIDKADKIREFYKMLNNTFEIDELQKYKNVDDITTNIFKNSYDSKIDKCMKNITNTYTEIQSMIDQYPKLNLKLEKIDEVGYYFKITTHKYSLVNFVHTKLESKSKYRYIRFGKLSEYSDFIIDSMEYLNRTIRNKYNKFLTELLNHNSIIRYINRTIAEIDVATTSRYLAEKYKYNRPALHTGSGYIYAKNLRHPIIESISNVIYVPHTIKISEKERGLLIYGVNSSGKSSIMKSVGINLIMAQAGMYVPADKFIYTPYKNIQTRILGNDNMHNGQGSFAVEMIELRGILSRSGADSIVFGDEICRGTETISGTAIASAAILDLLDKSTSFIFTTHLHQIAEIPEIQSRENLGIYHMGTENVNGEIIYKRTLSPGPGDTLYGLEIAKAMDLPLDFIEKCYSIRNELLDVRIVGKKSRYNSKKIIDVCEICGINAIDTNHIKPQKDADRKGFINSHHKNVLGNLMGICKKCHNNVTNGKIVVNGYVATTSGRKIDILE